MIYYETQCPIFYGDNPKTNFIVRMETMPETKKTMLDSLVKGRTNALLTVDEYRELAIDFRRTYPQDTFNLRISPHVS